MKRIFSVFLCLTVWLSAFGYDFKVNGIYYKIISDDQVEVAISNDYHLPSSYSGSIFIPSSVNYEDVTYNVTSIGISAFFCCSGLTSVTIPSSVMSIGFEAFAGCSGLNSVTIPSSVTSIGNSAFLSCSGLKSISIPSSVTTIESSTFEDCTGLISVTIPSSVTSIGNSAFENCVGLISVTIPSSVTRIGYYAFKGCSGLESISVAANNTVYDSRNDCNAIIKTATNTLITGCINTTIPYGVTSIEYDAFYGCIGLTSITIPSSVTSIGSDAFNGCGGLTSISIPSSVTDIYDGAFENCPNIEDITCYAITPPTIRATTFENYDATLYVPASRISLYQITDYWKEFNNIQPTTNIRYTVTVNTNNEQMGTTIGSGTYDENTIVQLIAIPNSGYVFQQWNDGNTDNPRNITVTHDSLFTAYFALPENEHYTLEDQGVYYIGGKVYNSQNLYIKLYYSDGRLISSGTNDIDMSSCPNGIYIVTDGKGGFLKINHYR